MRKLLDTTTNITSQQTFSYEMVSKRASMSCRDNISFGSECNGCIPDTESAERAGSRTEARN